MTSWTVCKETLFSLHTEGWSFHIGVPRDWGWAWGYSPDLYEYVLKEFGFGPLFLFAWWSR